MKMKKVNEPTPGGGDYSELYFMNEKGEITEEKFATGGIIRELKNDGALVNETFAVFTQ